MKHLLIGLVLLLSSNAYADTCVTGGEAQSILIQYLLDESNIDYPGSFDEIALIADQKFFEGHHHAQVPFYYRHEEGGSVQGTVIADVYCDGRANLIFSIDHD